MLSLCDVDRPYACACAQIEDTKIVVVLYRRSMQLVAARLQQDGVHHVHSDLLLLQHVSTART